MLKTLICNLQMSSNWFAFFYNQVLQNSPYNALKAYTYQVGSFPILSRYLVIPQY